MSDRPVGVFATALLWPIVYYNEAYQEGGQPLSTGPPIPEPVAVVEGTDISTSSKDDWRTSYRNFLTNGLLSQDKTEAQRLHQWAKSFVLIREYLYKKGHIRIRQLRIPIEQGSQLLEDIHNGTRGHHAALRSLMGNAFWQGFY